jgi:antitoxin HicB
MEYFALFNPAPEGGYVVTFPDIAAVTQGDDEQDAMAMAQDALRTMLWGLMKHGDDIPEPRRYRGSRYRPIALDALSSAKVELYRAFRASGMRKVDLARALGIPKTIVDRLFDLRRKSHLDQIEAAFGVLGKRMGITVEDAA